MSKKNQSKGKNPSENVKDFIENQDFRYEKLERSGLNYISKQQTYLVLSLIFPVFLSIIQIFNLIFIISIETNIPSDIPINRPFNTIFVLLGPLSFFLMISLFGMMIFIFLIKWNKKVTQYKNQQKFLNETDQSKLEVGFSKKPITLTKIFYDIIYTMKTLRIMFLILNVICIYHFGWIIFFFFFRLQRPPQNFLSMFTVISQIVLIVYLIYEWRHFYRWNKKFKLLRKLERKLYSELYQSKE